MAPQKKKTFQLSLEFGVGQLDNAASAAENIE
jgi:hypothetical protein